MKKMIALILTIVLAAVNFSGCGTGPNLGFTYEEFGQMLQQRIDDSDYGLELSEWRYGFNNDGIGIYTCSLGLITLTCASEKTGPVTKISIQKKYTNQTLPHATQEFRFLAEQIYEICNPEFTDQEKNSFQFHIINRMEKAFMGDFHYNQKNIEYYYSDEEFVNLILFSASAEK